MAKQGISVVEQHVEKVVLGIAVLLFAFLVFRYVVSVPVTATVQGRQVVPNELDRILVQVAEQTRAAYRTATYQPAALPQIGEQLQQFQEHGVATVSAMPAPVARAPEFERPEGGSIEWQDRHDLATVIAPVVDGVYTGVTYAGLFEPVKVPVGTGGVAQPTPTYKDITWAFVRISYDMFSQHDVFRQRQYTPEQSKMILFLDVQLQRQQVFPDGSTGEWEDVEEYRHRRVEYPQTVRVQRDDSSIYPADVPAILQVFSALNEPATVEGLLYSLPLVTQASQGDPFPPQWPNGTPALWAAQDQTGAMAAAQAARERVQMQRSSYSRRSSGSSRGGSSRGGGGRGEDPSRGGGAARRAAAPTLNREAMMEAMMAMNEARQLLREKRYTEALAALGRAEAGGAPPVAVAQLRAEIQKGYDEWAKREAERMAQAQTEGQRMAEIWAIDPAAPAGKTYRYRARVVLFNIYAHPDVDRNQLKNPQDGSKVALEGEWSEPSPPIRIASPRHFFLAGANQETGTATISLYSFKNGLWFKDTQRAGLGDPIGDVKPLPTAAGRTDVDFRTGRVVVDVGHDTAVLPESDTSGDKLPVRLTSSDTLVSMDADGLLDQRWAVKDRNDPLLRELEMRVKASAQMVPPTAVGLTPAR